MSNRTLTVIAAVSGLAACLMAAFVISIWYTGKPPASHTYSPYWEEFCQGQTGGMSCEEAEQADEEWARTHP